MSPSQRPDAPSLDSGALLTAHAVHRMQFGVWTALIVLIVLPWTSYVGHTHWARVAWIPFVSPPVPVGDIVRNVLLYLPWGYLYVRQSRKSRGAIFRALGYAMALSVATEATQLFSHGRFPSSTDVTCNVAGAWIGGRWARRRAVARGRSAATAQSSTSSVRWANGRTEARHEP